MEGCLENGVLFLLRHEPATEAGEARDLGLVDMLAEDGGLDALVGEFTGQVLANSWHTNRHTKRILRETEAMPLAAALAHEQYTYPGYAPDYAERVAAFGRKERTQLTDCTWPPSIR